MVEEDEEVEEVVDVQINTTTAKISLVKKVKATIVSQFNVTIIRNLATQKNIAY